MKRVSLLALVAVLFAGVGVCAWKVAGLPPARLLLRYGLAYAPEPTGRVATASAVEFLEISPGCFQAGSLTVGEGGDFLGRWCFRLGLPWGDQPDPSDENPLHWVEFPHGYWIARTEVTNVQYEAFRPHRVRSKHSQGDQDPVVDLTWEEARDYCAWLARKSGLLVRLPSEMEWESACRAGSRVEFCSGDDEMQLKHFAWFDANSGGRTHEVGTRRSNNFGLSDLHGNVWEWCEDTFHASYVGAPRNGVAWTNGGMICGDGKPYRVVRGGSFTYGAALCRSAARSWNYQAKGYWDVGFRPSVSNSD